MRLLLNLLLNTLAVFSAAYILPGVEVETFITAAIVAVVLGTLNTFVKPILVFLTLPITFLTLGLFTLVINAILVIIAAELVPGFDVTSFLNALLFSVIVSLFGSFLGMLSK
ncbi:phage holin family protein [candidate division WWE3 bacterium]|uniref:Phage holin family protein n=1 Tax=candidate division WWE3 bacterium TaxID=2053526 RepID=A0A3A4ZMU1_UNCKA|nr:MAG: phage holin family protein [candidate division WWE3 bacterium]